MMQNLRGRVATAAGMIVCCGLTMAVAVGSLAFLTAVIAAGVAVVVAGAIFTVAATVLVTRPRQAD